MRVFRMAKTCRILPPEINFCWICALHSSEYHFVKNQWYPFFFFPNLLFMYLQKAGQKDDSKSGAPLIVISLCLANIVSASKKCFFKLLSMAQDGIIFNPKSLCIAKVLRPKCIKQNKKSLCITKVHKTELENMVLSVN